MIRKGTTVKWKWGDGFAEGTVEETYQETISRNIDGNKVTRHGTEDNRAFLIKQDDGTAVLKLESEVERK